MSMTSEISNRTFFVLVTPRDEAIRCPTCKDKPHDVCFNGPQTLGQPWELSCSNGHDWIVNIKIQDLEGVTL